MCMAEVTEMHHSLEPMESVNEINHVDIEINESATNKSLPKETLTLIPMNSLFMFHKYFYPKPRIMLLDAELSNEVHILRVSREQQDSLRIIFN